MLGIVLIVQFMVILDATIVSVALPSIQHGLHFGSQLDLQWVVNGYALFFGGSCCWAGGPGTCSAISGCLPQASRYSRSRRCSTASPSLQEC
jgi:MFS family permease